MAYGYGYTNSDGNDKYFVFNGTQSRVPNNQFVLDVVHAYNFLKSHNAGENFIKGVTDPQFRIHIQENPEKTKCKNESRTTTVFGSSRKGLKTSDGGYPCKIKVEELKDDLENDLLKTDTVYVSDTIFNLLKNVPGKIDTKADSVNHYDWRMAMFNGREYVYVSSFDMVAVSGGILAETPKLSYWRYVLKVYSKYYNDYWSLDLLSDEKDIKR